MSSARQGRALTLMLVGVVLLQTATATAEPRERRDVIDADETHGMPPGFHEEDRPRYGMIIGGAVATAVGGGLFFTGYHQKATGTGGSGPGGGGELLMLNGGLALAVGIPMLAYGLLSPRKVYVRNEPSSVAFSLSVSPGDMGARLNIAF